uniref:DNA-directed RNA polymerase n=1 Tax=Oryza glaberrima TaxID=4538 RepID=I1QMC5_ORYGL
MTKAIPKIGSCRKVCIGLRRNARFSLRKSARRITKGVIHVQASFNNTIITVTDPQGRVVFWSSAGTCGFKSSRKTSPYTGQRTAVDAIRIVGLQRAEVMVKGAGQADTVGIALRRALLGEIEGTCITHAKFGSVPHGYSTIAGIEESVQEILLNLKEIVLRSNLYGVRTTSICVKGPRYITAQDIILPPSVEIVDTAQPIANLTEPTVFRIELRIKRDRGYHTEVRKNTHDGSYPIDAVSMPVRNVNYSIFACGNEM